MNLLLAALFLFQDKTAAEALARIEKTLEEAKNLSWRTRASCRSSSTNSGRSRVEVQADGPSYR